MADTPNPSGPANDVASGAGPFAGTHGRYILLSKGERVSALQEAA